MFALMSKISTLVMLYSNCRTANNARLLAELSGDETACVFEGQNIDHIMANYGHYPGALIGNAASQQSLDRSV